MSLAFRPVAPAEMTELADLWVGSWSQVYAGIDFDARREWLAGHIQSWIAEKNARLIGAYEEATGRMAGFILIDVDGGHLDQICVRHDVKGAGVGLALIDESKRLCPAGLTLGVNVRNTRAVAFYEREGFVRTGESINPQSGLPIYHYRWRP
jgi:putative acetyltransferase